MRASPTKSALPLAMIVSAWDGSVVRLTANTEIATCAMELDGIDFQPAGLQARRAASAKPSPAMQRMALAADQVPNTHPHRPWLPRSAALAAAR